MERRDITAMAEDPAIYDKFVRSIAPTAGAYARPLFGSKHLFRENAG
jgi:hypothetical protein